MAAHVGKGIGRHHSGRTPASAVASSILPMGILLGASDLFAPLRGYSCYVGFRIFLYA